MCKIVKHGVVKNEQGETDIFFFPKKLLTIFFLQPVSNTVHVGQGTGLALIKISVFF